MQVCLAGGDGARWGRPSCWWSASCLSPLRRCPSEGRTSRQPSQSTQTWSERFTYQSSEERLTWVISVVRATHITLAWSERLALHWIGLRNSLNTNSARATYISLAWSKRLTRLTILFWDLWEYSQCLTGQNVSHDLPDWSGRLTWLTSLIRATHVTHFLVRSTQMTLKPN